MRSKIDLVSEMIALTKNTNGRAERAWLRTLSYRDFVTLTDLLFGDIVPIMVKVLGWWGFQFIEAFRAEGILDEKIEMTELPNTVEEKPKNGRNNGHRNGGRRKTDYVEPVRDEQPAVVGIPGD